MTAPRHRVPATFPGNYGRLREPRMGIMLHYDASANDDAAVQWLLFDPRCRVSYNWLVLDDGTIRDIAPVDARAWHAGRCKSSDPERLPYRDANSAFYGVSAATNGRTPVTAKQKQAIIDLCRSIFRVHGWPDTECWRIVGHRTERQPPGARIDPEGPNPARPILSTQEIREAVCGRRSSGA